MKNVGRFVSVVEIVSEFASGFRLALTAGAFEDVGFHTLSKFPSSMKIFRGARQRNTQRRAKILSISLLAAKKTNKLALVQITADSSKTHVAISANLDS